MKTAQRPLLWRFCTRRETHTDVSVLQHQRCQRAELLQCVHAMLFFTQHVDALLLLHDQKGQGDGHGHRESQGDQAEFLADAQVREVNLLGQLPQTTSKLFGRRGGRCDELVGV